MKLPGKWNLFDFTGISDFNHWDQGIEATQKYDSIRRKIDEKKKLYNWIKIGCIVVGFMTFGKGIGILFLLQLIFLGKKEDNTKN